MNILLSLLLLTTTTTAQHLIDISAITNHINVYREIHQAPRVEYSSEITDFSKSWADYMATNRKFEHSGNVMYGENIAMIPVNNYYIDYTEAIIQSIDMFYDEVKFYDYHNPGFNMSTGHFTQLVWVDTKEVGFSASTSSNGYIYICTNYDPPGNFYEDFEENVKPPKSPPKTAESPIRVLRSPPPKSVESPIQVLRSPPPKSVESPSLMLRSPPKTAESPIQVLISPPPKYVVESPIQVLISPPPKYVESPPSIPSYTLTIKYPALNQTHVEKVLCPSLVMIFNSGCKIQLVSTTGIYYGSKMFNIQYSTLRQTIASDIANFTKNGKIVCKSTITVHLNGGDMFRYLASSLTCL